MELFELIQTLEPTEKRYFRSFSIHSGGKKSKQYLKLFDLLERMSIYDGSLVQEHFRWKNFKVNYASLKKYLYNLILDCLENYRRDQKISDKIQRKIRHIRLLSAKGLYVHAAKRLKQAQKLAAKYELPILQYELAFLDRKYAIGGKLGIFAEQNLVNKHQEVRAAIGRLSRMERLREIHYRFLSVDTQFGAKVGREQDAFLENLLADPVMVDALNGAEFFPKLFALSIQQQHAYLQGKFQESLVKSRELLQLWEEFPDFAREMESQYLAIHHNYINRCLNANAEQEADEVLAKLKGLPIRSETVKVRQFESTFGFDLALSIRFRNRRSCDLQAIEKGLEKYGGKLNQLTILRAWSLMSIYCFYQGDLKAALHWIQKSLEASGPQKIVQFQSLGRLFFLLLHFELGNFDLLEYEIRNAQIRAKNKQVYEFETLFLGHLKKVMDLEGAAVREEFSKLAEQLEILFEKPDSIAVYSFFDFLAWARSRTLVAGGGFCAYMIQSPVQLQHGRFFAEKELKMLKVDS